jgi:Activator of Hsp90 ATPase homolog 1-like protein
MISIAPVRKQITVNATQQQAFDLFTLQMSRWWPKTHSTLKSPLKQYVIEPQVGGRWYAVAEDGSTGQTGYVIAWDRPQGLVLAWQLSAEWQFDSNLVTEVEVRFIAQDAKVTRVELEHRHLERMGERAAEVRSMVDAPGGWGGILESFKQCANG